MSVPSQLRKEKRLVWSEAPYFCQEAPYRYDWRKVRGVEKFFSQLQRKLSSLWSDRLLLLGKTHHGG